LSSKQPKPGDTEGYEPVHVIIPCYNEERTVYRVLESCVSVDVGRLNYDKRLLVVDDGSTVRSAAEIERFMRERPEAPVRLIRLERNRGKGMAIRAALDECEDGVTLIQDADLEYSPEDYCLLLEPIRYGLANVVYGSRWTYPGTLRTSGWLYSLGGYLENVYLHALYRTNISDIATCYKVMRTDLMKRLDLQCNGFEFCPEATAKLLELGETILEVPIRYNARKKIEGKKISWIDFFIAIWTLSRIRFAGFSGKKATDGR
jgi:dolichol-phosphate mannosyltransferase